MPPPAQELQTWTTYLASLSRAPSANEVVPTDPQPTIAFDVGRAPSGGVAIGDSVIVALTSDKRLAVLRRTTGDLVWRRRIAGPGAAGPLFMGRQVFVASGDRDGAVEAYDLRRGKRLWSRPVGPVSGPLGAIGHAVYAATSTGRLVALDTTRGDPLWTREFRHPLRAGVTVVGPHLFVASDDSLFLVLRRTGERAAAARSIGAVRRPPAISGRLLVTASPDGIVAAYALPTLERRWQRSVASPVFGSPSIARDTVFVATLDGGLWRIPLDAPSQASVQDLGTPMRATPAPVSGGVLVGTLSGEVLFLTSEGAPPAWRLEVNGPLEEPPVVWRGTVYLIDGTGQIRAWDSHGSDPVERDRSNGVW